MSCSSGPADFVRGGQLDPAGGRSRLWTLARIGTSEGAEPVQQQSTAVSPLLSAVQRGFARTKARLSEA
jgi:hypothetical protein